MHHPIVTMYKMDWTKGVIKVHHIWIQIISTCTLYTIYSIIQQPPHIVWIRLLESLTQCVYMKIAYDKSIMVTMTSLFILN